MERPSINQLIRARAVVALGLGLLVFAGVALAREAGLFVSWELGAFDNYLRADESLRERLGTADPEPVVAVVWIGEEEIRELGHPLPDAVVVDALRRIRDLGARAIGIDIYRDRPNGEGWDDLRDFFFAYPNVVIVEKLPAEGEPGVPAPPFLPDRSQVGFADFVQDPAGVTRRGLLMLWDEEGQAYLSLALQLALRHLHFDGIVMGPDPEVPEYVAFGPTTVPPFHASLGGYKRADDGGYQFMLDYRRPNGSFPHASLGDVLAGEVDAELFRDRVVLIGTASPSVKDNFQTPTGVVGGDDGRVYGAELHAQAVDQLVRYGHGIGRPMVSYSERAELLWILVWCLAASSLGTIVRSPASLVFSIFGGVGVLLGVGFWAYIESLWIPVVPSAVGGLASLALAVAYATQQERAEKAVVRDLFGRFVSKELVNQIWNDRQVFMEGGRPVPLRVEVTVMLSDLSGYTSKSESKEPAEVMGWIGTYMDRMAYLVEKHHGIVNDFLGDGLMASFGVPIPSETEEEINRDATNAVDCALAMWKVLEELNDEWARTGEPTARMRIGIFSGPSVVGSIGSAQRLKFATVGNTVNTAARLESFDKLTFEEETPQATCRVLVGGPTLERLGDQFVTRPLGSHLLKGKGQPVAIHRVMARRGEEEPGDSAPGAASDA